MLKRFDMLKQMSVLLMTLLVSTLSFAQEVDKTQPYNMMKQVAEDTFDRLATEQEAVRANPELLKVIVEEELMPYVNSQYAALKLLGSNVKKPGVKKKDVYTFIESFERYLVTSYAQALTLYTNQTIEFEPEKPVPADRRIIGIKVDIIDAPAPNIKLEFKLRKNKKSGEWLAFDMSAEGISLLDSMQSEWNSQLRTEGILAVAKELDRLADTKITFEGQSE
ncbi:ABC transporter substrate-binding protein [Vibrio maerlii]|uniref:ABC transporter substrate-binding protein n=1 Tax=Vibrio maerlii TaxID=2231648 RepID=UPI0019D20E70|nr:ABC transporter substrate-binding protein [Vibrio maerlii]